MIPWEIKLNPLNFAGDNPSVGKNTDISKYLGNSSRYFLDLNCYISLLSCQISSVRHDPTRFKHSEG